MRRALEGDIPQLISALAPDVSAVQIRNRFQEHCDGYREMLVAELGGSIAGTVSIAAVEPRAENSLRMFALDVGPAYRRQGMGTILIEYVEARARHEGYGKVNLEVALDNGGAIRLYERLGYFRRGEPFTDRWTLLTGDGRYEQVEERSWVMVKTL